MIVDSAVYQDGKRIAEPASFAELAGAAREGKGVAWLGLHEPTEEELTSVAREFELHELAVEDAVHAHQRPKLEWYGEVMFLVLRPARYIDETETVEFGEIHVFVGPNFVITIRHGEAIRARSASNVRWSLVRISCAEARWRSSTRSWTELSTTTRPSSPGWRTTSMRSSREVFGGARNVSRRTYELIREVIEFRRAIHPLPDILVHLMRDHDIGAEEKRYLRDVHDHALAHPGASRRLPRAASEHPQRQPHTRDEGVERGGQQAERRGQEDLRLGGDSLRTNDCRDGLRDELRPHARAPLEVRLRDGARDDAHRLGRPLLAVQSGAAGSELHVERTKPIRSYMRSSVGFATAAAFSAPCFISPSSADSSERSSS